MSTLLSEREEMVHGQLVTVRRYSARTPDRADRYTVYPRSPFDLLNYCWLDSLGKMLYSKQREHAPRRESLTSNSK